MENPAPREVRLLLGQLIQKWKEREVSRMGQLAIDASSQEVVLDVHLDGVRYVLLCVRPSLNHVHLSPREQDLVRMIAAGHLNKAIAQTLQISPWTICTHLRRIFGKLGVHSRAAMVAKSFELGLAAQHGEKGSDLVIIHPPVLPLSTDGSPSHSERINDRQFQRGDSHAADRPHAEGVGIRS